MHWDERRQRFIAMATVGYDGRGKRIVKSASGTSKSAALKTLRHRVAEYEEGLARDWERVTVEQIVDRWLELGRAGVSDRTRELNEGIARLHVKPYLGKRRVKELRTDEVDRWLRGLAGHLATSTLKQVRGVLKRSIDRAIRDGLAARNVVDLCPAPPGRVGRASKSLTLPQARDVLALTREHSMHAYIAVSLLTGLRPEEVRALTWDRVHLDPPADLPPFVEVWRSVRVGGDTKTPKSRRSMAVAGYVAAVLENQRAVVDELRIAAGTSWVDNGLVFPSEVGTVQDRHNVLRKFRSALGLVPGLNPDDWSPRDLRHSFASLLSQHGLPIEEISRLMGHSGTAVTELVYRHELRPVLQTGAATMDAVFNLAADGKPERLSQAVSQAPAPKTEIPPERS